MLACVATCWTVTAHGDEYPIAILNPAFMTIRPLEGNPDGWFVTWHGGLAFRFAWYQPLGCYWVCLLINFVWARHWLIRHFDRLVERTQTPSVRAPTSRTERVRVPPEMAQVPAHE